MASHSYTPRINMGGNFCGHNPLKPAFILARPANKGKGGLPPIITLAMERVKDYYNHPTKLIPSLNLANGSARMQRSERREACIRLIAALLKRMDLVSLRVGIPTETGFMSYTVDYIAEDTGMTLKRVERALKDLKGAGIITVARRCQAQPDGTYKGLASVKAISKELFGALDLLGKLRVEREKANKRLKKKMRERTQEQENKSEPVARTKKAKFSLFLGALGGGVVKPPYKKKSFYGGAPPDNTEYRKQLMLTALDIKQRHPEWSRDKAYEEAEKRLLGPRLG